MLQPAFKVRFWAGMVVQDMAVVKAWSVNQPVKV